ncbi:hypothetical protein G7045_11305 [Acidovorax sp. HDW3]|uniref:hypothetical protein n=1 Tax=Acidovorax sp. HDW3 TaxID=2714923 RepID=UPI00140B3D32|nr:hypothetical protein [Acidovorax sp. HDW3]QIL44803.1 hypothetical protein G7045_11305 [Acidovorax sp. HDW3]
MDFTPDPRYAHPSTPQCFIYLRLPVERHGHDPLHQRENTIDQALRTQGLGEVLGWGASLGEVSANGRRLAWLRVDISANTQASALLLLRQLLPTLQAPTGTEVHYQQDGQHLLDILDATGWLFAQSPQLHARNGPATI